MGRGKVVLERIPNKINRQVTFSKRRSGLLKKAYELSLLCDVEVAVVIFSSRGKLSEFASNHNVDKILERYRQYCYSSSSSRIAENEKEILYPDILKLRATYESLQRSQRHFLGEDLEQLSLKDLQEIEKQLDKTLYQARQRKTELMLQQLEELQQKVQDLKDENKRMNSQLEEEEENLQAIQGSQVNNNLLEGHPLYCIYDLDMGCGSGMNEANIVMGRSDPTQGWI
ncbi:hypothetical protein Patl1_20027 [Pistacia atlantica]|uniref:Uncharacterized protein n=1 Tax=Pistacia atlantica TaxID=434234 RepID=A0ACC1BMG1_9ROSI|nr:hypothetical protein Patl1_20027 [Pistacia atlantica]